MKNFRRLPFIVPPPPSITTLCSLNACDRKLCIARNQRKMRRGGSISGNKPVASAQAHSAVIAIFAEHSTLVRSIIIISCIASNNGAIVQEIVMKRREFLKLSLGATAAASLSREVRAQASVKEISIGYQKTGVLVIARQQAVLEKRFAAQANRHQVDRVHVGAALAGGHEHRQRRHWRSRRYAADLCAGGERQHRLCRGIADHQRAGHSGSRQFQHSHHRRSERQARRIHQGHQRAQRGDCHAGKGGADL